MDKDIVRRIVRSHINELRHCYDLGLARDPALKGSIEVQFTIDSKGKVPVAVVYESSVKDLEVGQCFAQAVKRWTFPKPKAGGVVVNYPFVVKPGGFTASTSCPCAGGARVSTAPRPSSTTAQTLQKPGCRRTARPPARGLSRSEANASPDILRFHR